MSRINPDKPMALPRCVALTLLLSLAAPALAVPIPGLFSTGVDGSGSALGDSAPDPHYDVLLTPARPAEVIFQASIPGSWVPNSPTSRWVWETDTGQPTNVTRTFRTTFDLTGLDPATAQITGQWATDNSGLDILINGVSTGNTCGGFTSLCSFGVTSGFAAGLNTLDFQVHDGGVISGFLVASISGTADALQTPEPATVALLGLALAALGRRRRPRTPGAAR